jgi:hypothetical protein
MGLARTASTATLRLPLGTGDAPASAVGAAGAGVLVAIALALAIVPGVPGALGVRASLAIALVAVAGAIHRRLQHRKPPRGWVTVDTKGVHRIEQGKLTALADFDGPVGVTVFATADRACFAVAITSPRATRYVRAVVRSAHDAAAAPTLMEWSNTAAEGVVVSDESSLTASDAEKLVAELARRAPGALDRFVLSDATGEPMVLDRSELRLGSRRIDLCAPLEWHASLFQELGAYSALVLQATWVRQLDVEVVLVAPMPADNTQMRDVVAALTAGEGLIGQAALARDVPLMDGSVGEPPPRELRCAIDGAFMLPLRRALDRAPRMVRSSSSSPLGRPVVESRRVDLDPREKLR